MVVTKQLIKLNGWQTVTDYATSKGVSTQVVTNWIGREKIQAIKYPLLNNLTLVKDK
jgi:hypothetical protein